MNNLPINPEYNVYIGARYVPKIFGEWDNTIKYEPLSIVLYQGNSYTSKTYVPIGADISNEIYWVCTGNYNAQVEQYRLETKEAKRLAEESKDIATSLSGQVEQNKTDIAEHNLNIDKNKLDIANINGEMENINQDINGINSTLEKSFLTSGVNIVTVGPTGAMFKTITSAVEYIKSTFTKVNNSNSNNIIVDMLIYSGEYNEGISLEAISGINFVGLGEVLWNSESAYPVGCVEGYGTNHFENIIFRCTGNNAYCFHYEGGGEEHTTTKTKTLFKNCKFESTNNASVGVGGANKFTNLEFINCEFYGKDRDIYLHNSTHEGSTENYITFKNCKCTGTGIVRIEDQAHVNANRSSILNLSFSNNAFKQMSFYGGNQGNLADKTTTVIPFGSQNINIGWDSFGNSGLAFNKNTERVQIEGYYAKGDKGGWDTYNYTIPIQDANKYDWLLYQVITSNGQNVTEQCTLDPKDYTLIVGDPSTDGVNGMSNITVIGTPK